MNENKKELPDVKPMEEYHAPKIPSLDEVYKNPKSLKELPARWAKNAAVTAFSAAIGVLGMGALAACTPDDPWDGPHHGGAGSAGYFVRPTEQEVSCNQYGMGYNGYEEFDLVFRIHHGGSGGAGYVVYLTEQEALGIIRRQLEVAGLCFGDIPPGYTAFENDGWMPVIGLNLFDATNNVAISKLSFEDNNQAFIHRVTPGVKESFARQTDITVGVFEAPVFHPPWDAGWDAMGDWIEDEDGEWVFVPPVEPTDEQIADLKAEARPILEEQLNEQIQAFIALLRAEGIVE